MREEEVRTQLCMELLALGFKPHRKGTRQVLCALLLVLTGRADTSDLRHGLYPAIAYEFRTTPEAVERNIRYAIETVWTKGNLPLLHKRFGYTVAADKGKPTNRAFFAQMQENLRQLRIDSSPLP